MQIYEISNFQERKFKEYENKKQETRNKKQETRKKEKEKRDMILPYKINL
jgi:hypothetical protein